MKTGIICTMLFCSAAAGFVAWRVHAVRTQLTTHFAIVEDQSMSHGDGCQSLFGLAEQVLNSDGVTAKSTLAVFVLGDQTTSYEPRLLGRYSIPRTRKVLEGRAADRRRQQDILRDIGNKCQTIRGTNISPIFLAVKQAIADLQAQGCSDNSHCALFVDSDLDENIEFSIKKRLDKRNGVAPRLPAPINNEGIEVTFCGLAVSTGRVVYPPSMKRIRPSPRASGREAQLRRLWLGLFIWPKAVEFQPYCSRLND